MSKVTIFPPTGELGARERTPLANHEASAIPPFRSLNAPFSRSPLDRRRHSHVLRRPHSLCALSAKPPKVKKLKSDLVEGRFSLARPTKSEPNRAWKNGALRPFPLFSPEKHTERES